MRTTCTADAAVRLMLNYPFWSELYYSMTVDEDTTIPTMATDGRGLWVNPDFWTKLKLDTKIAALAHEIAHKMLLHSSRRGARDVIVTMGGNPITLWNVAADHVVNNLLAENGFTIPSTWIMDKKYAGWSTEAVYADLERQLQQQQPEAPPQGQPKPKGGGDNGNDPGSGDQGKDPGEGEGEGEDEGNGNGNTPTNTLPGLTPQQARDHADLKQMEGSPEEVQKHEEEVKQAVHKALMTAKAAGKSPLGIDMAIDDIYEAAKEPWYNHLHRFMQSLSQSEYNWARINKKAACLFRVFAPHHYADALGPIAVYIDASGSVYEKAQQAEFAMHCNAILAEAKPEKIFLGYFDARVHRVDEIDRGDFDFKYKPVGGGGTDFRPIFKDVEERGIAPAVLIVLTDMLGPFPTEGPDYPVIWASILPDMTAPFGEVIHVET